MKLKREAGLWYCWMHTTHGVFLGFSPCIAEAIKFTKDMINERATELKHEQIERGGNAKATI